MNPGRGGCTRKSREQTRRGQAKARRSRGAAGTHLPHTRPLGSPLLLGLVVLACLPDLPSLYVVTRAEPAQAAESESELGSSKALCRVRYPLVGGMCSSLAVHYFGIPHWADCGRRLKRVATEIRQGGRILFRRGLRRRSRTHKHKLWMSAQSGYQMPHSDRRRMAEQTFASSTILPLEMAREKALRHRLR